MWFIAICIIIFVVFLIGNLIRSQIEHKKYLANVLRFVDDPAINIFDIVRNEVIEDPYSMTAIKKFDDFALLTDFDSREFLVENMEKTSSVYIISKRLKGELEDYKVFLHHLFPGEALNNIKDECLLFPGGALNKIKDEYMAIYTGLANNQLNEFWELMRMIERDDEDALEEWDTDSRRRKEQNYPLPDDWSQIRCEVIERDKERCILCGEDLRNRDKHIHHIRYRAHGGDHSTKNLVCLCKYCHATLRQHYIIADDFRKVYYVNRPSRVMHAEWCKHATSSNVSKKFANYDSLVKEGYKPCRHCHPIRVCWDDTMQNKKILSNMCKSRPDIINKVILSHNPLINIIDKRHFCLGEKCMADSGVTSVKKEYANLLGSAKADPDAVDFTELRMAYARACNYIPPCMSNALVSRFSEAIDKENMNIALQVINQLLDTCYLDIQTHIAADSVYEKLGDKERATYHRKFALGLIESIYRSGNGQSCETAFVVFDVGEEYAVLDCLDMLQISHFTTEHKGLLISGFECLNPGMGETVKIYFNAQLRKGLINHFLGTGNPGLEI